MFRLFLLVLLAVATMAQQRLTFNTFERQEASNRPIYIERQETQLTAQVEQHEVNFSWSSIDDRFTFIFTECNHQNITTSFIRPSPGTTFEGRSFSLTFSTSGTEPLIVNMIVYGFENDPLDENMRNAVVEYKTTNRISVE